MKQTSQALFGLFALLLLLSSFCISFSSAEILNIDGCLINNDNFYDHEVDYEIMKCRSKARVVPAPATPEPIASSPTPSTPAASQAPPASARSPSPSSTPTFRSEDPSPPSPPSPPASPSSPSPPSTASAASSPTPTSQQDVNPPPRVPPSSSAPASEPTLNQQQPTGDIYKYETQIEAIIQSIQDAAMFVVEMPWDQYFTSACDFVTDMYIGDWFVLAFALHCFLCLAHWVFRFGKIPRPQHLRQVERQIVPSPRKQELDDSEPVEEQLPTFRSPVPVKERSIASLPEASDDDDDDEYEYDSSPHAPVPSIVSMIPLSPRDEIRKLYAWFIVGSVVSIELLFFWVTYATSTAEVRHGFGSIISSLATAGLALVGFDRVAQIGPVAVGLPMNLPLGLLFVIWFAAIDPSLTDGKWKRAFVFVTFWSLACCWAMFAGTYIGCANVFDLRTVAQLMNRKFIEDTASCAFEKLRGMLPEF